jgi:hypothetical protein
VCRHRVRHAGRVHQRRPCVDRDRDALRLDDLLPRRALLDGGVDVDRDAPVALPRDRYRQRDQLTRFRVEVPVFAPA